VRACSYFVPYQLTGERFSEATGVEGIRRAARVGRFEAAAYGTIQPLMSEDARKLFRGVFRTEIGAAEPGAGDLLALASEPGLDFVVLSVDLGVPVLASNGRVYVYDCRALRTQETAP
jgi:hypothetical protein